VGRHGEPAGFPGIAAGEAERLVGWLRVLAIALIGAGQGLEASSPTEEGFIEVIAAFSAWSVVALVWVHVRPVTARFALVSTIVDVAAITALALLSGGAFSQARLAYLLVPIAVAFRFRPVFTALASVAVTVAYLAQALADPAASRPSAGRFIAVYAGYLAWVGLAACLLSYVLGRRTRRVTELAVARQRLMAEALTAEERERKALAEGLHDHAIQNLLSARHDLEEAAEERSSPPLQRADRAIGSTIDDLREAIFELHPYVLEEAGLAAALRAMGQRAARRAGFRLHVEFDESDRFTIACWSRWPASFLRTSWSMPRRGMSGFAWAGRAPAPSSRCGTTGVASTSRPWVTGSRTGTSGSPRSENVSRAPAASSRFPRRARGRRSRCAFRWRAERSGRPEGDREQGAGDERAAGGDHDGESDCHEKPDPVVVEHG
jgi:two-component system NarL family sensor kinase